MRNIFYILPLMMLVSQALTFLAASRFHHHPPWPPLIGLWGPYLLAFYVLLGISAWCVLLFAMKAYRRPIFLSLAATLALLFLARVWPEANPTLAGLRAGVAGHGEAEYAAFARTVRDLSGTEPFVLFSADRTRLSRIPDLAEVERLHRALSQHPVYHYNEDLRIVYAYGNFVELTWGSGMLGSFGVRYFDGADEGARLDKDAAALALSPRLWVFLSKH